MVSTTHLNKGRVQNHQRQSLTRKHPLIRYRDFHLWIQIRAAQPLIITHSSDISPSCLQEHRLCMCVRAQFLLIYSCSVLLLVCKQQWSTMREERTPETANHLMSWLRSSCSHCLIGGWPLGGGWSSPNRQQEGQAANKAAALRAA